MIGYIAILGALMVVPSGEADARTYTDGVKIVAAVSAERPPAIRTSLANLDYSAVEVSPTEPASPLQAPSGKRQRSLGSRVAGGVLGAVAGFFAGRHLGHAMGGYGGYIIGGPVGAIAGGILGAKF